MPIVTLALHAMATRFELVLHGEHPLRLRAAGEEALAEIERLEAQLSLYHPTSELAHLNACAARGPVRVTPSLFALLRQAQELHRETHGAFDISVAPLVHCWGFLGGHGHLPEPGALAVARSTVGMGLVELDPENSSVRFAREGVMLDLGAIGKGYAIERAIEILREAGVTSALLHGGTSTVYALGNPPGASCWKIALPSPRNAVPQPGVPPAADVLASPTRAPQLTLERLPSPLPPGSHPDAGARPAVAVAPANGPQDMETGNFKLELSEAALAQTATVAEGASAPVLATVLLHDQAISVSAVWGRCFLAGEKLLGHVLDPRTGRPVQGAVLAAVVLPSATETDALSTALLVLGSPGHQAIWRLRPAMRTLLVVETGNGFRVEANGGAVEPANGG